MKKTFAAFMIIIVFGVCLSLGMSVYIKGEDKINYISLVENGDRELIEGLSLDTQIYPSYEDFYLAGWEVNTTFDKGIISKTNKSVLEDYRIGNWITMNDLTYDTSVSTILCDLAMEKDYDNIIETKYLNAVDENGENDIIVNEIEKAMVGKDCFFVWHNEKLYRLETKLYPEKNSIIYKYIDEAPYKVQGARRSNDDSVIMMIAVKNDGNYVMVMDAVTGRIISEYCIGTLDYMHNGEIFWMDENGDYIFLVESEYKYNETEEGAELDRKNTVYVIDKKNEFKICDEFSGRNELNDLFYTVGYAYDKNSRRLAVLGHKAYSIWEMPYVFIDIFENESGKAFHGEYECNLSDWIYYEDGNPNMNGIGEVKVHIMY